MMRRLRYWLGVWRIQPWPKCEECGLKAKWSAFVDWGAADKVDFFYCDAHLDDHEMGGVITNLLEARK